MRDPVSPAVERRARAALEANATVAFLARSDFEPLPGGLGNQTWRVDSGGCHYVVRLHADDDAALGIDRSSELALLESGSAAGIAPDVIVSDRARHLLVTRFVPGAIWTRDDARQPRQLARLAGVLEVLHSLRAPPETAVRSFRVQAERLEREIAGAGLIGDPAVAAAAHDAFERLERLEYVPVLTHNDLHHRNVVDDGRRLTLIDWEYGGLGDPCYDLASCLCYHDVEPAGREALLAAYRGPARLSRLPDVMLTFDYVQWLWYRVAGWGPGRETPAEYARHAAVVHRRLVSTAGAA